GTVLEDRLQVRLAEIGVVEHVEEFRPEREISILLEGEPFERGEVEIDEPGSDDGVSSYIPEEAWNRSAHSQWIRKREGVRIVPVLRGSQLLLVRADAMGRRQAAARNCSGPGSAHRGPWSRRDRT